MTLERLTTVLLLAWLLVLATASSLGNFYIGGWALLSVLAAAPVLLMRQINHNLALSESLQAARR